MKKFVCGILAFTLLAIGVLGCAKKETVPARGVWDGRTYTNTEAGIKLTVPDGYNIYSDEELIEWKGYPESFYDDVKSQSGYYDVRITDENSKMSIKYDVNLRKNYTVQQYMNLTSVEFTTQKYNGEVREVIYEDIVEIKLSGNLYLYRGYMLEGVDDYYAAYCLRVISGSVTTFMTFSGNSKEQVNAYLAFFDTASVE
ncbi:MAG TPA: hypothetical protein PK629_03225 [Oscillospiraceae bacterium]|nr:hypothetical protein [Oscillospiraceae bacterium]HPF55501.1 hypothetical protein [Clostridiales bacterium]HPK34777.1 hypothetical protein [Oscillospiraceae bacterium]HPR76123.1 hypothetical protein [Oscillospiraceae bacterium]